jgi:phage-related protein
MESESPGIVSEFFEVLGEMFSAIWDVLPGIISFVLWVVAAFIILPCVFIAGTLYPAWMEWGEEF